MSLAQYRSSIKIFGEKSALFNHRKDIFDGLEMGLSHAQIHHFLTSEKGLSITRQALTAWLKNHKPKSQVVSAQKPAENQENTSVTKKQEAKVEHKEAPNLPNDDEFYVHLRKVADKRAKWLGTNPYITQETQNEDSSM